MPSPAALKYALDLAAERVIPPVTPQTPPGVAKVIQTVRRLESDHGRFVSPADCSKAIDWLKTLPRRDTPPVPAGLAPAAVTVGPGTYLLDGHIWIVTPRKRGPGVYARALVEQEAEPGETHPRVDLGVYDRAASLAVLAVLTEEHRMTFASARPLMLRYGRCFAQSGSGICGIPLTAEESVAVAMGPVCGPKFEGYHEAIEEYRASKKHDLYEQARKELGIVMTDLELYRTVGGQVNTVKGIERKLDAIPA